MLNGVHDTYLENRVLSADPMELVRMLYQGAIGGVQDARKHLGEGNILERSRSISGAIGILTELMAALDHERGGAIASQLAGLYDYMQKRLLEANFQQIDAPLSEVLGLLTTLSEGWAGISQIAVTPAAAASPWSQVSSEEPKPPTASPWSPPVPREAESATAAASPWSQPVPQEPEPPAASPWSQPWQQETEASYAGANWSL